MLRDNKAPRYYPSYLDILEIYPYAQSYVTKGEDWCNSDKLYIKKTLHPFYQELKEKYPEFSRYTNKDIKKHVVNINKLIGTKIVEHREGVELPDRLGVLMVGTYGKRTKSIDWKASNELDRKVLHKNLHSQGYGGWVYYITSLLKYPFVNSNLWWFEPARELKTGMAEVYRTNWKKYVIIPCTRHIQNFVKNYWKKERAQDSKKEELSTYNALEGLL